jgi:hypothetical protein
VLCGIRIRYTHLLVHLADGDLTWSQLLLSGGSRPVYVCYKFDVRSFRSIQGFNGDDIGSGAPVLSTHAKTYRLSSTTLDRLRQGSGDNGASTARSGGSSGR